MELMTSKTLDGQPAYSTVELCNLFKVSKSTVLTMKGLYGAYKGFTPHKLGNKLFWVQIHNKSIPVEESNTR